MSARLEYTSEHQQFRELVHDFVEQTVVPAHERWEQAGCLDRSLFTEARRSTDPLSGFFLCRRALVDGIEFRPVGFKILLELLVLLPREVRVEDVPLQFMRRERGSSKASARQGLLYLRHLRSLFLDVKGSARRWKFGLVGLSGVAVFLPLLALLSDVAHLPSLLAG